MTVTIFADYKQQANCRSCRAVIVWTETVARKKLPFDFPIIEDACTPGGAVDGRALLVVDTDKTKTHFATCPDGKQWSAKRRRTDP